MRLNNIIKKIKVESPEFDYVNNESVKLAYKYYLNDLYDKMINPGENLFTYMAGIGKMKPSFNSLMRMCSFIKNDMNYVRYEKFDELIKYLSTLNDYYEKKLHYIEDYNELKLTKALVSDTKRKIRLIHKIIKNLNYAKERYASRNLEKQVEDLGRSQEQNI